MLRCDSVQDSCKLSERALRRRKVFNAGLDVLCLRWDLETAGSMPPAASISRDLIIICTGQEVRGHEIDEGPGQEIPIFYPEPTMPKIRFKIRNRFQVLPPTLTTVSTHVHIELSSALIEEGSVSLRVDAFHLPRSCKLAVVTCTRGSICWKMCYGPSQGN